MDTRGWIKDGDENFGQFARQPHCLGAVSSDWVGLGSKLTIHLAWMTRSKPFLPKGIDSLSATARPSGGVAALLRLSRNCVSLGSNRVITSNPLEGINRKAHARWAFLFVASPRGLFASLREAHPSRGSLGSSAASALSRPTTSDSARTRPFASLMVAFSAASSTR